MFKFKGISTKDMQIVVEEELKLLKKASRKFNSIEISGRNGNIYEETGYADVEISLHLYILNPSKLNDIYAWLDGFGLLEYQDKISQAYIYTEQDPVRAGNIYTLDINLIRAPFWNLKKDDFIVATDKILNEGNVYSEPIIRLEKGLNQEVDIAINDIRFKYDFGNDDFVELDCESGDATMNGLNRNMNIKIGYELPILNSGENIVKVNSGDCTIKVKRKDRFL